MSLATKPFTTNYRVRTPQGFMVLNGEQIVRIEARRVPDKDDAWEVVFYLTDGFSYSVFASDWTRKFVNETFQVDKADE